MTQSSYGSMTETSPLLTTTTQTETYVATELRLRGGSHSGVSAAKELGDESEASVIGLLLIALMSCPQKRLSFLRRILILTQFSINKQLLLYS